MKIIAWLFSIYILALPIVRPLSLNYGSSIVQAADVFFLFIFLFWLWLIIRKSDDLPVDSFVLGMLLLLGAFLFSTIFSTEPSKSTFKLIGLAYLVSLALVAMNLSRDSFSLQLMIKAWLIGTAIIVLGSVVGLIGFVFGSADHNTNFFLSHSGSLPNVGIPRIRSFFENANMMANYLNVSFIFAIASYSNRWISLRPFILLISGIAFSAIFTLSAGIGGIFLSAGIFYWAIDRSKSVQKRRLILAGSILLAIVFLLSTMISPSSIFEGSSLKASEHWSLEPSVRTGVWADSVQSAMEYPIVGRGTGTDAANLYYRTINGQGQVIRDAHNAWLNVFGQAGLLGLAAFLIFCFLIWRRLSFSANGSSITLVAVSCAVVGSFFYQNLTGSFEDARHLWVLIGILGGVSISRLSGTEDAA